MTSIDLSQLRVLDAIDHAVTVLGRDGRRAGVEPRCRGPLRVDGRRGNRAPGRRPPVHGDAVPERRPSGPPSRAARRGWATTKPGARTTRPCSCTRASRRCATTPARSSPPCRVSNDVSERRSLEEMVRQDERAPADRLRDRAHGRLELGRHDRRRHVGRAHGGSLRAEPGHLRRHLRGVRLARASRRPRAEWSKGVAAVQDAAGDLMSEHRVVWPDGTVHWLEARGRPLLRRQRRLPRDGRRRHRHRRAQAARSPDVGDRHSCAPPRGSSATCRRPSASRASEAGVGKQLRTPSRCRRRWPACSPASGP